VQESGVRKEEDVPLVSVTDTRTVSLCRSATRGRRDLPTAGAQSSGGLESGRSATDGLGNGGREAPWDRYAKFRIEHPRRLGAPQLRRAPAPAGTPRLASIGWKGKHTRRSRKPRALEARPQARAPRTFLCFDHSQGGILATVKTEGRFLGSAPWRNRSSSSALLCRGGEEARTGRLQLPALDEPSVLGWIQPGSVCSEGSPVTCILVGSSH
jgi:hypothetical protein